VKVILDHTEYDQLKDSSWFQETLALGAELVILPRQLKPKTESEPPETANLGPKTDGEAGDGESAQASQSGNDSSPPPDIPASDQWLQVQQVSWAQIAVVFAVMFAIVGGLVEVIFASVFNLVTLMFSPAHPGPWLLLFLYALFAASLVRWVWKRLELSLQDGGISQSR